MSDERMCKRGLHALTPDNLIRNGRHGRMSCKACRNLSRALRTGKCAVKDCKEPPRTRGWCSLHYERWRTYGDPQHSRMSGGEVVDEVEWLLAGGMSSFYIADALNRSREAVAMVMRRQNRPDLAAKFVNVEDAA